MVVCYRDVWVETLTTELREIFSDPKTQGRRGLAMTPHGDEAHYYSSTMLFSKLNYQ